MAFLPEWKKRTEPLDVGFTYRSRVTPTQPWSNWARQQGTVTEEIISVCHSGTWPPPLDSRQDIGGEMSLHRTWKHYHGIAPINSVLKQGHVSLAVVNGYSFGTSPASSGSNATLDAFGTSAVAKVLPTNPNASLATTLGELKRDGLPTLPGSSMRDQVDLARKSGNEFLNIEFGWLPLISDLRSFADSVRNSRLLIEQYVRDSDRKIRRRFVPDPVAQTLSTYYGTGQSHLSMNVPKVSVTRQELQRYWFSGAFRYHVPTADGLIGRLRRLESECNFLFGTRITPELIWNLAPWSWAIDWFTNVGDVIHNISQLGSDGLVMQYGYAMRHMRVTERAQGIFDYGDTKGHYNGFVGFELGSEWKQRRAANPYGFGIDDLSLSAIQLAILSALGLTRGKRNP